MNQILTPLLAVALLGMFSIAGAAPRNPKDLSQYAAVSTQQLASFLNAAPKTSDCDIQAKMRDGNLVVTKDSDARDEITIPENIVMPVIFQGALGSEKGDVFGDAQKDSFGIGYEFLGPWGKVKSASLFFVSLTRDGRIVQLKASEFDPNAKSDSYTGIACYVYPKLTK